MEPMSEAPKKRGRPPKAVTMVKKYFHCLEKMWEEVGAVAKRKDTNRSEYIRKAVERQLRRDRHTT